MKIKNMERRVTKRKSEAKDRQETHNRLTDKEKLKKLDNKLGKDIGAKKERTKLNK